MKYLSHTISVALGEVVQVCKKTLSVSKESDSIFCLFKKGVLPCLESEWLGVSQLIVFIPSLVFIRLVFGFRRRKGRVIFSVFSVELQHRIFAAETW